MASSIALLLGAIALLMIDSIMELAFVTSMVAWLHARAGQGFLLSGGPEGSIFIRGKPEHFLLNQGHASNGAAGTAFIVIGLGGLLSLWLRHHDMKRIGRIAGFARFLYNFWLIFTILSALFSLGAFIGVMVVTYTHSGQSIDVEYASTLDYNPYDLQQWTPQGWFAALLKVGFYPSTRSDVQTHLNVMRGWEWNLIPMTILGFVVLILAFRERKTFKERERRTGHKQSELDKADDIELSH